MEYPGGRHGILTHLSEACSAHHGDVGVGDWQDEGGAIGRRRQHAKALLVTLELWQGPRGYKGVGGQEGRQVSLHSNGAHARAATAVGYAEGLVQIQVAHVCTDDAWRCQAHLCKKGGWLSDGSGPISGMTLEKLRG